TLEKTDTIWTHHLITLAIAVFMTSFGQGLFRGASTNFFVETLGLSGRQVLWLNAVREIPGLALMFIAALLMPLPLSKRTALCVFLMGVGYGLYAAVHSYVALLTMAVIASVGFHNWMPLESTLSMGLVEKEQSGRVRGSLTSVRSLASIVGMGAIALCSRLLQSFSLRNFYLIGGGAIVIAAALIARLPNNLGVTKRRPRRLLIKRRYWLYYVLILFQGSYRQVFGAFGTLVLVQYYGWDVWKISLLLVASSIVNLIFTPYFGKLIDEIGERPTLSTSYMIMALCFIGYATIHNDWILGALLILINLLLTLNMALTTYVNRIAPEEELPPTLSAGVSINHITSVSFSLLAGTLVEITGYENLFWGATAIVCASIPFALAMKTSTRRSAPQPQPAVAE
ncbi:MAG: MFS transporter, partial [Chloroflexota bacterium]|nr:MFS transporter [Chloroflexota bacterium]